MHDVSLVLEQVVDALDDTSLPEHDLLPHGHEPEATVLKVEMTDECLNTIKSGREDLIHAETTLLANHRRMMLQEIRNQNEEMQSFIKSGKGVYLSPKVFWWWAGISYLTSQYSFWCLLQLIFLWLKC